MKLTDKIENYLNESSTYSSSPDDCIKQLAKKGIHVDRYETTEDGKYQKFYTGKK